jgi:hypothetical protein
VCRASPLYRSSNGTRGQGNTCPFLGLYASFSEQKRALS